MKMKNYLKQNKRIREKLDIAPIDVLTENKYQ